MSLILGPSEWDIFGVIIHQMINIMNAPCLENVLLPPQYPPMRPSHFPIRYNPLEELPLDLSMPGTSTQQGASQGTPSSSQQGSSRQRAVYTDTPRPGTSRNLEIMDESPRGTANISTFLEEGEIMKGDSPKIPKTPPPIISPLKRGGNRTRGKGIPSKRTRRSLFFE